MNYYVYYSEEEEIYDSKYKGHFNRKLADWAISRMVKVNPATGEEENVKKRTIDEWDEFIKNNKINIPDESYYDGYYLWHMIAADNPKSLEDNKHIAIHIEEVITDPDGLTTNILACFKAKMNNMEVPIFWEKFL